jgi:hypothetical protein
VHAVKGTREDKEVIALQLGYASVEFAREDEAAGFIDYEK